MEKEHFIHTYTHTHTLEYYFTIKKKEILPFAATWMNLEDIMLSEISQTQKDTYCMISLICGILKKKKKLTKLLVRESRMVVTGDWGMGEKGRYLSKYTNFQL